jgi:hypothetical protein
MSSAQGELVTETFDYDGQVTAYLAPDLPLMAAWAFGDAPR